MNPLLQIRGLEIRFRRPDCGRAAVLRGVDLAIGRGEIVGLVGESGSGKSQTAAAILGLTPANAQVTGGSADFEGRDLLHLSPSEWQQIRGRRIALVPQEAFGALNPCLRIGSQISESLQAHLKLEGREARRRSVELLDSVAIERADEVAGWFPHQLSGGMRQRVTIAIALACNPDLVLADEPTTALDAITRVQILDLLERAVRSRGSAMLLITHDLTQARQICDRVAVMYAGQIVEEGPVAKLYSQPSHPYTRGLLRANLPLGVSAELVSEIPGRSPSPWELPPGCAFHPRCDRAGVDCREQVPAWAATGSGGHRCLHPCE